MNGRPAAGALVVLHDARPRQQIESLPIPRATTDVDGAFKVSSNVAGDGAPAGAYRVTVTVPTKAAAPGEDPESSGDSTDLLAGRYADPMTTTLTCEVKAGDNQLPPFELNY